MTEAAVMVGKEFDVAATVHEAPSPVRSFRPTPVQPQGALSTEVQGLHTDLDELRALAGKLQEVLFGSDRDRTNYQAPTEGTGISGGIKIAKSKIAEIKEQLTRITARV